MKWQPIKLVGSLLFGLMLGFSFSCGGGGGKAAKSSIPGASGHFFVKSTDPTVNGKVYLNQPIYIEFTQEVDISSVDLNSVHFVSYDYQTGRPLGEVVTGEFSYAIEDGIVNKRIIQFLPTFPTNDTYDNGGFKPRRKYELQLHGVEEKNYPVIRSVFGKKLEKGYTLTFYTPSGTTPQELFFDVMPGGPAKVSLSPEGDKDHRVGMNFFLGGDFNEIKLVFNQPLNPASYNFNSKNIYLQYLQTDSTGSSWVTIPVKLILSKNLLRRSEVLLIPKGVLPTNAEIRVIVERNLEDLSGESNENNPVYDKIFGRFWTSESFEFQYDAIVEDFKSRENFDLEATHMEPFADWKNGRVKASFNYGGSITFYDFEPTVKEVVLNTDFCQVIPKQGIPFTVSGGIFQFRDVVINEGITVRGQGSNPLVILATGKVEVKGHLCVDGGDGSRVDTLNSANYPTPGGIGVCGGGSGGDGSPNSKGASLKGSDGRGAFNEIGGGGEGGHSGYGSSSAKGGGGGGGSFNTQGDPLYKSLMAQKNGYGGNGLGRDAIKGVTPPLGGKPGPVVWRDSDNNNNFYGRKIITIGGKQVSIIGELKSPVGGQGGGGGGDRIPYSSLSVGFPSHNKGGGGGAGAGILIVKAIGPIYVRKTGRITANGGNGGGGEQSGNCSQGGGGAGGSGGMILLMSAQKIVVEKKDPNDIYYGKFPIAADGGIGTNGKFSAVPFERKYPVTSNNTGAPNKGGFGGLGLIELFVPDPEHNLIIPLDQIKPAPQILPSIFGYLSRARSKWIYTGNTDRQVKFKNAAKYLDNSSDPGKRGPEYRFAGTWTEGPEKGYTAFFAKQVAPGKPEGWFVFPEVTKGVVVKAVPAKERGSKYHYIKIAKAKIKEKNCLKGMRLLIIERGANIKGEWIIAGNTKDEIYLSSANGSPFSSSYVGMEFKVIEKYFDIWTGNAPGYPLGYVPGTNKAYPKVNIKIGFAFCSGFDKSGNPLNRYPTKGFVYDLQTPAEREKVWKDEHNNYLPRPYMMFDILFNICYNKDNPNLPRDFSELSPTTPKPEIRNLIIPFRF